MEKTRHDQLDQVLALLVYIISQSRTFDFHSASHSADSFTATEIGDMYEGVVEGSKDSGNAKDKSTLCHIRAKLHIFLLLLSSLLLLNISVT
jgi:hypothetical protein